MEEEEEVCLSVDGSLGSSAVTRTGTVAEFLLGCLLIEFIPEVSATEIKVNAKGEEEETGK